MEYFVRVDDKGNWTSNKYRKVTKEELDILLGEYGNRVLSLCTRGYKGAMAMWAYFKNKVSGGCYGDIINAYELLSDDSKSLVDREHEFRHAWEQYEELRRIRYHGSVENYYFNKAKEAKERFERSME